MSEVSKTPAPKANWDVLGLPVTATSGPLVAVTIGLSRPETLAGKRILDIGSGFSGLVPLAASFGIDAVGIDPRYANIGGMQDDITDTLRRMKTPITTIGSDIASELTGAEGLIKTATGTMKAIEEKEAPFIAADSRNLPFAPDSFDMAISSMLIGQINPDEDPEVYQFVRSSIIEALRVVKPGGSLHIGPRVMGIHQDYKDGGFKGIFGELESVQLSKAREVGLEGVSNTIRWEIIKNRKATKAKLPKILSQLGV